MAKKENWVWMGHPGHFIGSRSCKFFLNTRVGKYIVSTVGEYCPYAPYTSEREWEVVPEKWRDFLKKMGADTLGFTRFYETMVFNAVKDEKNGCCPWTASGSEKDFAGYNDPESAYKGHLKLCAKWAKKP